MLCGKGAATLAAGGLLVAGSMAAGATISALNDPFTGTSVDTTKWNITARGLEHTGTISGGQNSAGYDAPSESSAGLRLGGTTNGTYWYGSSLESVNTFSSAKPTTVTVDRVSLTGSGTAWRSTLGILQPGSGGAFLQFAENTENGWEFNASNNSPTGGGNAIGVFNSAPNARDGGLHTMQLVYTPTGGTNATVDIYLDGVKGATDTFTTWDNSQDFEVLLTGQARQAGDTVAAVFQNLNATATPEPGSLAMLGLATVGILTRHGRSRRRAAGQ